MRVFSFVMLLVAVVVALGLGPRAPLSTALFFVSPSIPSALQSVVQQTLPRWFWDPLTVEILSWPAWVFPLVFALFSLLLTIGRPSRRG